MSDEYTKKVDNVQIDKASNGYSVTINYDNSSYCETAEPGTFGSIYNYPLRIVFLNYEQMMDRIKREGL